MRRLNVVDAAEFIGVSQHTLRKFVRNRAIGFYRVGRRIVFDEGELSAWLQVRRVAPFEEAGK
jgi:excisionase family DNA binding protein